MISGSPIRSAAVLGAGVMGAQIAAHLANAGIPALLLDLTTDIAREGLGRARALKPDPFFASDVTSLIETGGFDADLGRLSDKLLGVVVETMQPAHASLWIRESHTRAQASRRSTS